LGHQDLRRERAGSTSARQDRAGHRKREAGTAVADPKASPEPDPPGSRRLRPAEDESTGDFTERVAHIRAVVFRRALAAIKAEGVDDDVEDPTAN